VHGNCCDPDLPVYFRRAARRIGLALVGEGVEPAGAGWRRLARRIKASGARAVYLQTGTSTQLPVLRSVVGEDVMIISSTFGGLPLSRLFDDAGEAARGVYVTIPGAPLERLPASGQRFVRDLAVTRPGTRVPTWAVYAAAATEALLDAVARSDGTRESVAGALATVDLPDSVVGPLRFDRRGEPAINPVAIVRADHGGEPDDGVITAGGTVVEVLEPPASLVGEPSDR
jgi:ABC-type branched-subunit amino acid transport system substrate-binding protein